METYAEEVNAALLKLLASLRKKQGYTLERLADLANLHRTTIGLFEKGERNPTVIAAIQVATALGVSLSDLLRQAEESINRISDDPSAQLLTVPRHADSADCYNAMPLKQLTGLESAAIVEAIDACHNTLDIIDAQLTSRGSLPIARLVELANLSSMIGNLLGSGLAEASGGIYKRNRPHSYPDLIPLQEPGRPIELKVALETNNPKGHLIKPGVYLTFRYVLGTAQGGYIRGKDNRGATVWIWEAKVGLLQENDFSFSSTVGDSGKTAVIRTASLDAMTTIYYAPRFNPYVNKAPDLHPE